MPLPTSSLERGSRATASHVGPVRTHYLLASTTTGTKMAKRLHVEPPPITSHPSLQSGAEAEPRGAGGHRSAYLSLCFLLPKAW